ncbi:MAG: LysM peptidoglycan-binding domain-containing protein, partial [Gammaproteobacteria bacterium]|nr:LysM peptidoglycan-binding domain-containing protein [Gammaproteobacteria bacterium]
MLRKILFCVLVAMAFQAGADTVALQPDHPQQYVVKKGDTLWDISGRFLRYPWQWPDIWEVNPQIENPHLIYPGDQLSLTYRDGKPILSLARGRRVTLSPSVRAFSRDGAIAPIPLDAIQQFLTRPRVVAEGAMENAAYVVGSQDGHLVTGMGNRIYVRGLDNPQTNKYSVFRQGEVYRDPR